ncbi:MAG: tetratricopeptide repeat protein, partial [Myxococcales bacterium]|nr:tetratricopeptide repeat protein [Myxococcales bacterium]
KLSRSSTEGPVAKLLALAKELREAGRPEVACVALRDGLKEWSESPELWADLGFALRECGDLPGAVEALQAATSLDPTNVTALEALAALCARLHRLYEVFDARLALLKLSPDSTAAFAAVALTVPSGRTFGPWIDYLGERARDSQAPWFVFRYLTRALVRDEGFEDAVLPAQRWVQLRPDDPEGWENLALAAAQTKRRAAALDALERAKELQSEDVTESMPHATPAQRQAAQAEVRAARHKVYAEVYSLLGMNSEAVQELKAAILAKPRDYAQHVDLGLAHARGGNADSALEEFQLAYDLCAQGEFASQFPDILANTRASILVRWSQGLQLLGKAQPAIETVSRIPSVAPDWAAETHREIAFIHFASGRFAPAIEAFEEAFRLNPELVWPDAHYKFAIALLKTGNREKALKEYGVLGAIANRQDLEGTGTPRQARAYLSELAALLYK